MTNQLEDKPLSESQSSETPSSATNSPASAATDVARPIVQLDESRAVVCYANFCRVTGTPEELILDFGLNAQPMGAATNVAISQRLVVNYYTAKRLLHALGLSIQRHEGAFGVLETDVQKRVTPMLRRAAASG